MMVFALVFQSCAESGETNKDEAKPTEEHASDASVNEEHATEDVEEEEDLVFIDGYEFHGIKELNAQGAVTVAEMQAKIAETGAFEGKISTSLTGVCKKAGCWVTIDNPAGDPIRVVFGEHAFFVPTNTEVGREVILEGVAKIDTTTIALQKHFLDDAAEAGEEVSQEQYDAITEDLVSVSFDATGILIK